jgi:hypothetical protein
MQAWTLGRCGDGNKEVIHDWFRNSGVQCCQKASWSCGFGNDHNFRDQRGWSCIGFQDTLDHVLDSFVIGDTREVNYENG